MTKHINEAIVKAATDFLILKNGSTTTLEVKNFLRDQSYNAKQTDVSTHMQNAHKNSGLWSVNDNGTYRTYSLAQAAPTKSSSATATVALPAQTNSRAKVVLTPLNKDAGKIKASQLRTLFADGDWAVFSAISKAPMFIYESGISRDHVRTHYARENGLAMADVRARMIKNLV